MSSTTGPCNKNIFGGFYTHTDQNHCEPLSGSASNFTNIEASLLNDDDESEGISLLYIGASQQLQIDVVCNSSIQKYDLNENYLNTTVDGTYRAVATM